ncbi:MAG: DUF4124 domain-containing protein, partial [Gammaproteobacteria bacterium]|nr:DUF4124 domain-containing protein [Gammaproteobacteria bacterium]
RHHVARVGVRWVAHFQPQWRAAVRMFRALAGAILCAVLATANAEIYQWIDEHGKVHFGDKPPPEVKRSAIDLTER